MKSRACFTPSAVPFHSDHRFRSFPGAFGCLDCTRFRRQRRLLLGVSILLIVCWTIGAIWLIGARRGERSPAEVLAQQCAMAAFFPGETERNP